jgi:hypothetical protein
MVLYKEELILTNYMEYSLSSGADSRSASQEISLILWLLKVYYEISNSLFLVTKFIHSTGP